jgi:hypothetical protein
MFWETRYRAAAAAASIAERIAYGLAQAETFTATSRSGVFSTFRGDFRARRRGRRRD